MDEMWSPALHSVLRTFDPFLSILSYRHSGRRVTWVALTVVIFYSFKHASDSKFRLEMSVSFNCSVMLVIKKIGRIYCQYDLLSVCVCVIERAL